MAQRPGEKEALLLVAMLEAKTGRFTDAIDRYRDILETDPNNFEATFWLSVLYRNAGELGLSLEFGCQAATLWPGEANVHSNLGLTQLAAQEVEDATASFERAIRLQPANPKNYEQLGKALQLQSRDSDALKAYQKAQRLAPNSTETLLALGQIAFSRNQTEEALKYGSRILELDPKSTEARLLVAGALIERGLASEAKEHVEAALAAEGKNSNALAMLGMRMQALGRMEEAGEAFRRSIELQPNQGFSYCALVRNSKITVDQTAIVEKMEELIQTGKLNDRGISFLHFALGKAYDDLRDFKRAMEHFDKANQISYRLKFGAETMDRDRLARTVDWTISTFTKDFIEQKSNSSNPSDCPIFIVGMMRSGTTLVEQILSSHPEVEGAGELSFWLAEAFNGVRLGESFGHEVRLGPISDRYLRHLKSIFPDAPHITDKMPGNYRVLGAIAAAFPNAKLIHTKRNPVDTCLSIFMTPNRVANDFANNRANIVFAYRQYERLMAHWESVLDSSRLLTVHYETLAANPEPISRDMIDFCALPWDDRCLSPQDNDRTVVTPSVWQVRQPVYKTSIERWRNYEPWLGEFRELAGL